LTRSNWLGSSNACAETTAIEPSALRQNSVEPQFLQKQRRPYGDDSYCPSCASLSTLSVPPTATVMNTPPLQRRHIEQWQTPIVGPCGVAVNSIAPQRHFP